MTMEVVGAEVYDPGMSGEITLPVRLEILVTGLPVAPTHTEDVGHFTVRHYHWLHTIEAPGYLDEEWDDENTTQCASVYNTSMYTADREPVMPVTVAAMTTDNKGDEVWMDFYARISRVQRILNRLEKQNNYVGYEVIPDPTYVSEKEFGWMLMHPARVCVQCAHSLALDTGDNESLPVADLPKGCRLVQVAEHKLVPMCTWHRASWNETHRAERERKAV